MTKQQFLLQLYNGLASLPKEDVEKSVDYYKEMIEDRMEDGLSEENAVAAIGSPEEIIQNILAESTQNPRPAQSKISPEPQKTQPKQQKNTNSGLKALSVLLIILGAPLWLPLLISVAAVVISVAVTLFAVIISIYAVVLSLGICALVFLAIAITGSFAKGLLFLGAALVCAGLTVLLFFATNLLVKGIVFLCKKMFQGIKFLFRRRTAQ